MQKFANWLAVVAISFSVTACNIDTIEDLETGPFELTYEVTDGSEGLLNDECAVVTFKNDAQVSGEDVSGKVHLFDGKFDFEVLDSDNVVVGIGTQDLDDDSHQDAYPNSASLYNGGTYRFAAVNGNKLKLTIYGIKPQAGSCWGMCDNHVRTFPEVSFETFELDCRKSYMITFKNKLY